MRWTEVGAAGDVPTQQQWRTDIVLTERDSKANHLRLAITFALFVGAAVIIGLWVPKQAPDAAVAVLSGASVSNAYSQEEVKESSEVYQNQAQDTSSGEVLEPTESIPSEPASNLEDYPSLPQIGASPESDEKSDLPLLDQASDLASPRENDRPDLEAEGDPERKGSSFAQVDPLTLSTAEACTYFVDPNGSDAHDGRSEGQPFQTLARGVQDLQPGETLCVRSGTYNESLRFNTIPSGSSWEEPVTVQAYPGERPILKPISASFVLHFTGNHHIVIEGFILDGIGVEHNVIKVTDSSSTEPAHHIRIRNCEVKNSPKSGILTTGGADSNQFIHLDVHHTGTTDFDHGLYIATSDNLIEGCRVHENAGWGVHVYCGNCVISDNVVRNNYLYQNAYIGDRGPGLGLYSGSGHLAYNNVIWGNSIGISINYGATDAGVYNNTVVQNLRDGIVVGAESTRAFLANNIAYGNTGSGFIDHGVGTMAVSNLIDTNPLFVDPQGLDFHLQSGSPAIDTGASVPDVTTDIEGLPRPQGAGTDLGAYEYPSASPVTFEDVPVDHPYYHEIEALYQAGYTAGCNTDPLRYCPDTPMIRAESAVFVERGIHGAEYQPITPATKTFEDVPMDYWGFNWVESLWSDEYTAGCGTDPLIYCPLTEHTRAEGCVFYLRMLHGVDYEPSPAAGLFTDVPSDWWGAGWVEAAYQAGLIEPCEMDPELRFCPEDPLTRGLAAYMMVQAKGLECP